MGKTIKPTKGACKCDSELETLRKQNEMLRAVNIIYDDLLGEAWKELEAKPNLVRIKDMYVSCGILGASIFWLIIYLAK